MNASSIDILQIQDFAKKNIAEYNEKFLHNPFNVFMCNCGKGEKFVTTQLISNIVCEGHFALVTHIAYVVGLSDDDDHACYQVAHTFWNDFVKNGRLWTYSKIQQEYKEFLKVNDEVENG
jgi:hypothetical protein